MYPIAALYLKPEKMAWAGARVREYFSLDADTQIILYAPTFRGYGETTEMLLDFQRCLEIFAEQGKRHDDTASAPKKYVLLWRLHPNLANRCREQIQNPSVVNATNYPDIYELVAACDILISDYSACIFDGALAGKPVFLYTPDLQQYCKDDRAFYTYIYSPLLFQHEPYPTERKCGNVFFVGLSEQMPAIFLFHRTGGRRDGSRSFGTTDFRSNKGA